VKSDTLFVLIGMMSSLVNGRRLRVNDADARRSHEDGVDDLPGSVRGTGGTLTQRQPPVKR
jgi:hypothetical protein